MDKVTDSEKAVEAARRYLEAVDKMAPFECHEMPAALGLAIIVVTVWAIAHVFFGYGLRSTA